MRHAATVQKAEDAKTPALTWEQADKHIYKCNDWYAFVVKRNRGGSFIALYKRQDHQFEDHGSYLRLKEVERYIRKTEKRDAG